MHYPVVIEPGNENTAWGVVVPDLPGCARTIRNWRGGCGPW